MTFVHPMPPVQGNAHGLEKRLSPVSESTTGREDTESPSRFLRRPDDCISIVDDELLIFHCISSESFWQKESCRAPL